MPHKKFIKEYRKEAVQRALTNGLARDQVAEDLGVGKSMLGNPASRLVRPHSVTLSSFTIPSASMVGTECCR